MASESSDMESSNQGSENSDQDSDAYEWKAFVAVRATVNDRDRYDCIPSSWLVFDSESGYGYQTTVEYRFPSLAKLGKGIKFRKNQKPEKTWPTYIGKMLLDTDSQAEAFRRITRDKDVTRKSYEEDGNSYSSTSELDSEDNASATKKQNNKKTQGTKRKKSEQENKNIKAKSTKIADESD